jgi:hypothetical protein
VDFELEARVLVDWRGKRKLFYRNHEGEEVNIQGGFCGFCLGCIMLG